MEDYIKTHIIVEIPFADTSISKIINVITISEVDLIKLIGDLAMSVYEVNGANGVEKEVELNYESYVIDLKSENLSSWFKGLRDEVLTYKGYRIPYKGKKYREIINKRKVKREKI